jgi:hypothetical protein
MTKIGQPLGMAASNVMVGMGPAIKNYHKVMGNPRSHN